MPAFRRLRYIALALIAGLAMSGCRDGVGPGDVSGTYVLESVNGVPVPLPGVNEHLSGQIELSGMRRVDWRLSYRADEPGATEERRWVGTFRLRGANLEMNLMVVDPLALSVMFVPPSFELRDGTITHRYQTWGAMSVTDMVEVYRRQ